MCWGVECGDGWYPLIETLCAALSWDGYDFLHNHARQDPPVVVQVKEKFGSLRFYVDGATEADDATIGFAALLSGRVCETCGTMNGTYQTQGWIRTTCKACDKDAESI